MQSSTIVGVENAEEEAFGKAVDEAFAVTSDCGTARAEARVGGADRCRLEWIVLKMVRDWGEIYVGR